MTTLAKRKQAQRFLNELPDQKIEVALDFLSYLKEKQQAEDMFKMQMRSAAYKEWLSEENDIYDKVFSRPRTKR
jgi:nitrate reductase assembly molybdenum cofactor insertion protein NarJ